MPAAVSLGFEIKLEIMVNRDKVRLMTTIARYKSHHEDIFKIDKYFGYDYIVCAQIHYWSRTYIRHDSAA